VQTIVFDDTRALEPHVLAWDALAVEAGRPFCAPAWMLSWWREARVGDARLRAILVFDEQGLAGVGPFFAQVALGLVEMRLLGAGFSHRIGPLARAGEQKLVADALASALATMRPTPASIVFEGIDREDRWPDAIAASWPSRRAPRQRIDGLMDAPVIELSGAYEEWMERRSRRFRKEARRVGRRLEEEGVSGRIASDDEAIDVLLDLHYARWDERGGSNVGDTARAVIAGAARELPEEGRLAVALLEAPSGPVAAELVLCAGETAAFWGGGFSPKWAQHGPGTQTMLLALRTLSERGLQLVDLGGGAHDYKQRLADANRPIAWRTVFPRGARYPLIRARLAPKHASHAARKLARRLPTSQRSRLTRVLRKLKRPGR
jgi:CelD/BcsL family acetyltransferase involved in cellulose biosynthesis